MKYLGQAGAQPGVACRHTVASHTVAGIEAGEFEIGLQVVVRQTNAEFVAGELLARGFELWAVGQSASESRSDVRDRQLAERLGLVGELDIKGADGGIEVRANHLAELILGLLEGVFGLDDTYSARGHLRFR